MGLDMYLTKRIYIGANYQHNNVKGSILLTKGKDNEPININLNRVSEIIEQVAYWRKCNSVHNWFVKNVQGGVDNCEEYNVPREKLKELIDTCKEVIEDNSKAEELLPNIDGFFFGGTTYDEWYFESLQDTIDMLTPLLKEDGSFYYQSSW